MKSIRNRIRNFAKKSGLYREYLANKRIKIQIPAEYLKNKKMVYDIIREEKNFGISVMEYFGFGFPRINSEERRKFIPDSKLRNYFDMINDREIAYNLFRNKANTYKIFGDYYKRDLTECKTLDNKKAFAEFFAKHPRFIIKPSDSCGGKKIRIIDNATADSYESLLNEFETGFVAEELIKQREEMAELHPESVNTVRIVAVRLPENIEYIDMGMRIGIGASCVDNASSGGIMCGVNSENGQIFSVYDVWGGKITKNPNTGKDLMGFVIPEWQAAKELVAELMEMLPTGISTVGWDLALTDDGWIVVEGNCFPSFFCQYTEQKGCLDRIEVLWTKLGAENVKELRDV